MYKLPIPANFKVTNLLNRNDGYSTNRLLEWSAVTDAVSYNIYRSFVEYTGFQKIATVAAPSTSFTDTTTSLVANDSYIDLTNITVNTWNGWYYRIAAVRSNGEEGYVSDAMSELESNVLYNPPVGNYSFGESKIYGDAFATYSDINIECELLEIRNRNIKLLQLDGQWVWFFKQAVKGKRCPYYADDLGQCNRGKRCPVCHGTGIADGGYMDPVMILVRLVGANRRLVQELYGLRQVYEASSWTIWSPILASRDFFVAKDGRRFEIVDVKPSMQQGGLISKQDFTTIEKMPTDPIYELQVPGPLP